MNEEKEKIIEFAAQKFMDGGFYKTTMDDLAAKLRISKKTIYKNFFFQGRMTERNRCKVLKQKFQND